MNSKFYLLLCSQIKRKRWYKLCKSHMTADSECGDTAAGAQCLCVRECQGSVMEEKWLIKELLLLHYHVVPLQSRPVRDIYQAGSSLPEVLGSCTRESQAHVEILITCCPIVCRRISSSHQLVHIRYLYKIGIYRRVFNLSLPFGKAKSHEDGVYSVQYST